MSADGMLREQLGTEGARHRFTIGVDQRLVLCACGWRDKDDANLSRPLTRWQAHVADALLPVVESYAAQKAAEELRAAAAVIESKSSHAYDEDDEAYEEDAAYLLDLAAALSPGTEKEKR